MLLINTGCSFFNSDPPGDKDLWCETRDLQSVECKWTVGRNTHLLRPTVYRLLGRYIKIIPGVATGWGMEAKKAARI